MGKHAKKETPAERIKRLERELKNEKDKNLILTKMIDIAEQEYGASIRKKYVPKHLVTPKVRASESGAELQIAWDHPAKPVSTKGSG